MPRIIDWSSGSTSGATAAPQPAAQQPLGQQQPRGYQAPPWSGPRVMHGGLGQQTVQMDPATQAAKIWDEITFWAGSGSDPAREGQLNQHALFLELGLEDAKLKRDASAFYNQWEQYRKTKLVTAPTSIDQAKALAGEIKPMCANLRNFKSHVLERLQAGEWLGWIFPQFAAHIRDELDYFVVTLDRIVNGQSRPSAQVQTEELCLWLKVLFQHSLFVAHLLDIDEKKLVQEATAMGMNLEQLQNSACSNSDPSLLALSQQAGQQLDQWLGASGVGTPKVKSIIHPVLSQHVVREGRRALQTFAAIKAGQKE